MSRAFTRSGLAFTLGLAGLLFGPLTAHAEGARVRGRVELEMPGVSLAQVGPVVVYLERIDGPPEPFDAPPAEVAQINARFEPSFLVVAQGQAVEMPNADAIYHNVFSFSRPNDFDLGMYPAGTSRRVVFDHAGVVKAYCSIHESMNATIFVAPGPHFAILATDGRFAIDDVPPGRYRLSTWCERLPGTSQELTIEGERTLEIDVQLLDFAS